MEPKDFSDVFKNAQYTIRFVIKNKEQIRNEWFDTQDTLLEMKEAEGFPEANEVINRVRAI